MYIFVHLKKIISDNTEHSIPYTKITNFNKNTATLTNDTITNVGVWQLQISHNASVSETSLEYSLNSMCYK